MGDDNKYNVQCRLVGKVLRAKTKEVLLAHKLFSVIPRWKTVKALLSFLVTEGIIDREEHLDGGMFDISRAHFMPKADRELYIELPDEAKEPSGVMLWRSGIP